MKTTPPARHATAALAVSLAPHAELPDGCNVQLFPDGEFSARDGRPASIEGCETSVWRMDADIAAAIIAQVESRETPLFIDYEHHTLTATDGGHKALAAGWISRLVYVPGSGLFASVQWTPAAREHIQTDEYRYISPLFSFDMRTGAVVGLVNAALTNNPALDGMAAVAAVAGLEPQTMETDMKDKDLPGAPVALSEELADRLRWMLNLPITATVQEIATELDKLKVLLTVGEGDAAAATSIFAALAAKDAALVAAKAVSGNAVPVEAVAALNAQVAALTAKIKEMETGHAQTALSARIDAALADGSVAKALEEWLRGLAKTIPAAAEAYLAQCKPIAALTGMQTAAVTVNGQPVAGADGVAALTAEDKEAAALLGISEEDFAKAKKEAK